MSFVPSDCYNIVMDTPELGANPYLSQLESHAIPLDDLKQLRDAGAGVALEFVPWHLVEPERGEYDWSLPDEMVSRCRSAGMKVLLMGPTTVPLWCTNEWYVWLSDGTVMKDHDPRNIVQSWGCLSPWNEEAQAYQNEWIERFCKRYNADDVLCIQSHSQEGESLLPPAVACLYDPSALASYRAFVGDVKGMPNVNAPATQIWMAQTLAHVVIAQQRIYVESHPSREAWMSLHPVYMGWPCSGVYDVATYLRAVVEHVKPSSLTWLIFSWFAGDFEQRHTPLVRKMQQPGAQVITGSEWTQGLKTNTSKAIESGFRALLTAPCHPYLHKTRVEAWEVEAFRQSRQQFMEASA